MRRFIRIILLAAATAAALAIAPAGTAGRNRDRTYGGVLVPAIPGQPRPLGGRVFHSDNWSGYVVTSKSHRITAVKGVFAVPSQTFTQGYSSTWAGIGGYTGQDLIQAGTSEFTSRRGPTYFAWFEKLPGPETRLRHCAGEPACKVSAGDRITVSVSQLSRGEWRISVTNSTKNWSWSKKVSYNSSRTSAEWILEAPLVDGLQSKLPRGLGRSSFGPISTYNANGATHTIARGNPVKVYMVYGHGRIEAAPSPLASNGQSFNVCAYSGSCPRP